MKNYFKSIFALLLIIAVASSCTKDEEESETSSEQSNYFKIGTVEYTVSKMALINYGTDPIPDDGDDWEGSEMVLVLYTSDLSIVADSDGYYDLSGKGKYIAFACFSSSETKLPSGIYTANETSLEENTYVEGWYELAYDSSGGTYEDKELPTGNFEVSLVDNVYEININCKDEDANVITGYFKGSANLYDESDVEKGRFSKK